MPDTTFNREKKTDRPVIALCYDFDKTLSPDDMQAQGYIQTVQTEGSDMIFGRSQMVVPRQIIWIRTLLICIQ